MTPCKDYKDYKALKPPKCNCYPCYFKWGNRKKK